MSANALIVSLSILGGAETIYLIVCRIRQRHPVCFEGQACSLVLESKFSRLFAVHNDVLGLFFFAIVACVAASAWAGIRSSGMLLGALLAGGSAMSAAFTYIQWRVIRVWCTWCLISAFTTWAMDAVYVAAH